jgi:single-stranded-DNA-specific exonuclease
VAHGSCRSLEGFNLFEAISACGDLLSQFGGHAQAAGVTLPVATVDDFRISINQYAAEHYPTMPVPALDIAVRLRPDQVNMEKLALLQLLEPFGCGNPAPLFSLNRMQLDNITSIGNGKHLRLSLSRDGVRLNGVMFQVTPEEFPIACGSIVNCVVSLERNEYRGNATVNVRIRDISFTDTDREALLRDITMFEAVLRREYRPTEAEALLSREQLAHFYSLLRASSDWIGTLEQLRHALGTHAPTYLQLLIALEIWRQAGIVQWYDRGERLSVKVLPTVGKADLTSTPLWQFIMKGDVNHV